MSEKMYGATCIVCGPRCTCKKRQPSLVPPTVQEQPMASEQSVPSEWLARWEEWRAKRWLDRRAALIEDIPTWRLVQELQQRGVLVAARDAKLAEEERACPTCENTGLVPPGDKDGLGCWDCSKSSDG